MFAVYPIVGHTLGYESPMKFIVMYIYTHVLRVKENIYIIICNFQTYAHTWFA